MPELPEVETTCRGIRPHVVNQTIDQILIREKRLRWPIPGALLKNNLTQQTILSVERRAKYILIHVPTGTLMIHLGMSGTLRIIDSKQPLKKHDHVDLKLSGGKVLRFNDPRRFGSILFSADYATHDLIQHLGPEPLEADFTPEYLFKKSRKRKMPLKSFIMDQQVVVGVGNIYASESLFMAKIHPLLPAQQLTLPQARLLHKAIQQILKNAIEKGGTSLKDFYQSDGKPGYFATSLKVYDREGEQCVKCKHTIIGVRVGQRSTYYCPECQGSPGK